MSDLLNHDDSTDGIDRRGFLKCMAWAGAGVVWAMKGGILQSQRPGRAGRRQAGADFTFVQISDSHVGFNKGTYSDVVGTFQKRPSPGSMRCRRRRHLCSTPAT